jgi:hypothetical protein
MSVGLVTQQRDNNQTATTICDTKVGRVKSGKKKIHLNTQESNRRQEVSHVVCQAGTMPPILELRCL